MTTGLWVVERTRQSAADVLGGSAWIQAGKTSHFADARSHPDERPSRVSCSEAPEAPTGKIQVLIFDADYRVLAALEAMIGAEPDLEVAGVTSQASAARAIATAASPCVALVDVTLRDEPAGVTLVQVLSQTAGCEVIAMSIHGGDRTAAHVAGARAFVVKGEDVDAMLVAIRRAGSARA